MKNRVNLTEQESEHVYAALLFYFECYNNIPYESQTRPHVQPLDPDALYGLALRFDTQKEG